MHDGYNAFTPSDLRVLVVEDEALVALILEDMLMELGHQIVGPFSIVSAGLQSAERESIDIAIIDLNLKGVSSLPIALALKARGIPVIFSTGYGRNNLPDPFGDGPLLQKPFQQADIDAVIVEALAKTKSYPAKTN